MGTLSGWGKRLTFTLDKDQIDAALSGFPVLVYLSAASGIGDVDVSCFFDELGSNANRKKVAFTSSDGTTELYAEIERFDYASEKAWYHVKVPSVSATVDEIIYIYYDSDHADNTSYIGDTTDAVAHNTWDSNFKLVMHMAQDPNGDVADAIKDSTSNANDGTPGGSMTTADFVDGKIGKGIEFDGVDDKTTVPASSELNPEEGDFTVEVVCKISDVTQYRTLVTNREDNADGEGFIFATTVTDGQPYMRLEDHGGTTFYAIAGVDISDGIYRHLAAVRDVGEGKVSLFINGAVSGTPAEDTTTQTVNSADDLVIGQNVPSAASAYVWPDVIDEIRISKTVRAPAWIKATHHSLWDTLGTFGAEENIGGETIVATPFTGIFSLTGAVKGGQKVTATPFTGTFSLTGAVRHIPRAQILGAISLINSLKVGSTLSLVNSLNAVFSGDITLVHDILSKIEGSQTLRNDIENLAKFNDTLSLINHILDADSGITQGDYYFLKNHGI